jgi:hypothetical protein
MKPHTTRDIIDPWNPGTPDSGVCFMRRLGRDAARRGLPDSACQHTGGSRYQWLLGHLDVRLERFYRAPDAGLACKQEEVR